MVLMVGITLPAVYTAGGQGGNSIDSANVFNLTINLLVHLHTSVFQPLTFYQVILLKFPPLPQIKPIVHA